MTQICRINEIRMIRECREEEEVLEQELSFIPG